MKRRNAILGAASAWTLASCGGGGEGTDEGLTGPTAACNITTFSAVGARINLSSFYQTAAQRQYQNLWCWAACISMIFSSKDRPVSQARIVAEAYGAPYNMAAPGVVIARSLNRVWADDRNRGFTSQLTGVYDAQAGLLAISDEAMIGSLAGGTPMVIGVGNHAMVLVELDYTTRSGVPQIVGGQVFDPWTGQSRCLGRSELTLAHRGGSIGFLASVLVNTR